METEIKTHPLFQEVKPHILVAFERYHAMNPHVWEYMKRFAYEALRSGRKNYGIAAITERVRWEVDIVTRGEPFKLNNNHKACYVRLLMLENPAFQTFFRRRTHDERYQARC